ncbi:MAG TPA: hypothetical protein VF148_08380 [Acidimicrobiia bacterium]
MSASFVFFITHVVNEGDPNECIVQNPRFELLCDDETEVSFPSCVELRPPARFARQPLH